MENTRDSAMTTNGFSLSSLKINKNLPEILTVTSGKGGVGKSSICVNLALLLAQIKKRILIIDADIHLGNIDLILGMRPKYTIADVISGKVELKEVITQGPSGIDILPAASAVSEMLGAEDRAMSKLVESFSRFQHNYDTILVDTGAGIHNTVMSFVLGSDKIVLVVTSDPASIADAYSMVKVVRQTNSDVPIMMISNMVSKDEYGESLFQKMNLMVKRFLNSELIYGGSILKDNLISESIQKQRPLALDYPNSIPINSLKIITRRLLKIPIPDMSIRDSFFDRFMEYRHVNIGGA